MSVPHAVKAFYPCGIMFFLLVTLHLSKKIKTDFFAQLQLSNEFENFIFFMKHFI